MSRKFDWNQIKMFAEISNEIIESMKKIFRVLKYILPILLIVIAIGLFGIAKKKSTPPPNPPPIVTKVIPAFTDFHLLIPSLDISVPVIADVDGGNKDAYFKALQGGVAHFKDTAKPGEGSNIFIFGHSSYYLWDPGEYKEIFKNLEDIKVGDEIDIWYLSYEYKYKVTETKVVEPSDVSVLKPTSTEQLTLMTCVPPGTAEKRLIVIAKPVPWSLNGLIFCSF